MPTSASPHSDAPPGRDPMVFLGNLEQQAIREACIGAAEYAAGNSQLDFEPWPLPEGTRQLRPVDFDRAACLLMTERAYDFVFGHAGRIRKPIAFVLGADPHPDLPSVEFDERLIGRMAAEHLIDRGYRELACVTPAGLSWASLRCDGFTQACRQHGLKCRRYDLPAETLPIYWHSNITKRHQRLGEILTQLPKPCGVFAVNDVIACFLIETARHQGFGVPHEIGVIGVDDDPVPNAAAGMAISSVQLPFRELGRQAAMLLDRWRKEGGPPQRLVLPPVRIVVRTSTHTFMVQNQLVQRAQAYIEEHRDRPLRVGEVIRVLKTTAVTLGKHFQRHLHVTPANYILLRRIEYAKELLRGGQHNVQEVSEAAGFHSCSYFCQIFRRITGTTPGKLRRPVVAPARNA